MTPKPEKNIETPDGRSDRCELGGAHASTIRRMIEEAPPFAGPGGVQVVKRDDFLRVVPKRKAFLRAAGLVATEVSNLDETRLDEKHTLVRARWTMHFEKDPGRSITDESAATYVLRQQDDSQQIVFQIDHQDLVKRVQELGLLAAPTNG